LQALLYRIQWDKKLAVRFLPAVPSRPQARSIMLDPTVTFGRPVLTARGVSTAVIVHRINAGEEAADVARDYGASAEEIMNALAYERAASSDFLHPPRSWAQIPAIASLGRCDGRAARGLASRRHSRGR
jgi:uncharacterized protein (DUF433 family)